MAPLVRNLLATVTATCAGSAILMAGSAQASLSCTFGSLAACSGTVDNLIFSNFQATGSAESGDIITILKSPLSGVYSISNSYTPTGASNPLAGNGTLSFNVQAKPGFALATASANSDTLNQGTPNFTFTSTLSGLTGSPLVSTGANAGPQNFTSGTTSSSVLVSWSQGSGLNEAYGSSLRLTTNPPSISVPGPLPLIGVGAAFGASRRLRRRAQNAGKS